MQRITAQSHREGEDELDHQHPTRDVRVDREEDRIQNEKPKDRALVPDRRIAEKALDKRALIKVCELTK